MKVPIDKIAHFGVSGMLVLIIYSIGRSLGTAVMITLALGLWKEILDGMIREEFCTNNLIANVIGIIIATGCILRII